MIHSKSEILSYFAIIDELLNEHYMDPNFCVKRMAEKLGISVSYLRELVECFFEISPQKLIESYRLSKSLELLTNDFKEYEIINLIGYSSTRTFRRAFRSRYNILPIQYKLLQKTPRLNSNEIQQKYLKKLWPSKLYKYFSEC